MESLMIGQCWFGGVYCPVKLWTWDRLCVIATPEAQQEVTSDMKFTDMFDFIISEQEAERAREEEERRKLEEQMLAEMQEAEREEYERKKREEEELRKQQEELDR